MNVMSSQQNQRCVPKVPVRLLLDLRCGMTLMTAVNETHTQDQASVVWIVRISNLRLLSTPSDRLTYRLVCGSAGNEAKLLTLIRDQ